jgi:signal transduction protein with GAF and PtsI domain
MTNASTRTSEDRASRLTGLMASLSQARLVDDALHVVCAHTTHITGVDRVSIALRHSPGTCIVYALHGAASELPTGTTLPTEGTLTGEVIETMVPHFVDDFETHKYVDTQFLEEMGMTVAYDLPLITAGNVIGTLNTSATRRDIYDEDTKQTLAQIAGMLAATLRAIETSAGRPVPTAFDDYVSARDDHVPSQLTRHALEVIADESFARAHSSEFADRVAFTHLVDPALDTIVCNRRELRHAIGDVLSRAVAYTSGNAIELAITTGAGVTGEHLVLSAEAPDTTVSISLKIGTD